MVLLFHILVSALMSFTYFSLPYSWPLATAPCGIEWDGTCLRWVGCLYCIEGATQVSPSFIYRLAFVLLGWPCDSFEASQQTTCFPASQRTTCLSLRSLPGWRPGVTFIMILVLVPCPCCNACGDLHRYKVCNVSST